MLAEPSITESMLAATVYTKTEKGRTEVSQRSAGLNPRQRSVLIMLDGRKPALALTGLTPAPQLAVILDELTAMGLIVAAAAAPAPAPAPVSVAPSAAPVPPAPAAPPAPASAPPIDPARLAQAKALLVHSAQTCLGPIAADLIRQIDAAADEHQLQRAIGHWHMAMRDSKFGRDLADAHLAQIKASLQAPASSPA